MFFGVDYGAFWRGFSERLGQVSREDFQSGLRCFLERIFEDVGACSAESYSSNSCQTSWKGKTVSTLPSELGEVYNYDALTINQIQLQNNTAKSSRGVLPSSKTQRPQATAASLMPGSSITQPKEESTGLASTQPPPADSA
ncbi:hypothetical protein Nepgr_015852 [Nepenthes gracilis]|uniref:Uncharacterized protein n=1 Tax=Nepenthes gracilis TaxID=150966 RepID=A0AAD3XRP2_NEPGR|nr:hypothetical protein Nepgr_015852 [Nepenthes gracilis]